jgi:hypothetical protein
MEEINYNDDQLPERHILSTITYYTYINPAIRLIAWILWIGRRREVPQPHFLLLSVSHKLLELVDQRPRLGFRLPLSAFRLLLSGARRRAECVLLLCAGCTSKDHRGADGSSMYSQPSAAVTRSARRHSGSIHFIIESVVPETVIVPMVVMDLVLHTRAS